MERDLNTPLTVVQITALRLFIDLILLASGDPPQWLTTIHGDVPRIILFEMINSITKDYSKFIQSHQMFIDVVRNQVEFTFFSYYLSTYGEQLRPFIARLLSPLSDFKLGVRLIHAVINIITSYNTILIPDCESLMSILIRMLEPEFPLWQRVLVLEAIKLFTEIPRFFSPLLSPLLVSDDLIH